MSEENIDNLGQNSQEPEIQITFPSYSDVRNRLRSIVVCNRWNEGVTDSQRLGFRQRYADIHGEGSDLRMPMAASYLSSGPEASDEDTNIVAFPNRVDRSFLSYMQSIGVLGKYTFIQDLHDLPDIASRTGRRIYNVDELPDEWDNISVNRASTVRRMNTKKYLSQLSAFALPYQIVDLFQANESDYHSNVGEDGVVYIKKNNTEVSGEGVEVCRNPQEFMEITKRLRAESEQFQLDNEIIVQPKMIGENKSYQFVMGPEDPSNVGIITVSTQLTESDEKSYAGNENPPFAPDSVDENVRLLIVDMAQRMKAIDPDTFGFVMCDYFETDDGLFTFDPGLRSSGNTPTVLARMFIEEATSKKGKLYSELFSMSEGQFFSDSSTAGMSFADYIQPIDSIMGPDAAQRDGACILPWGYNQYRGEPLFIAIAETKSDLQEIIDDTRNVLQSS